MDLTSPLKPDVFRVFTVVLLPGLLAMFPWLGWFFWPELLDVGFWKDGGIVAGLFVLAIALVAGMILENIGADVEVRYIDPYVCKEKGIEEGEFDEQWIEPGKVVEITVEAFATANLFAKGHRIRLDVSSSNYPHFDLNPNTGESQVGWSEHRIARNTLHLDREHPSRLLLPVRASATRDPTAQQD